MGRRLQQIAEAAAGRPVLVSGRLGELQSGLKLLAQEVETSETKPRGKLVLKGSDGQSMLELYEEEIARVIPGTGTQPLFLLLDGGTELTLQPIAPPL